MTEEIDIRSPVPGRVHRAQSVSSSRAGHESLHLQRVKNTQYHPDPGDAQEDPVEN